MPEQTPMEQFISEAWLPDVFAHALLSAYRAEKEYVNRHVDEYVKQIADLKAQVAEVEKLQAQVVALEADKKEMTGLRDEWKTKWEKDHSTNLDNVALYLLTKSELNEANKTIHTLTAERGVLLNGYEMIARYALPWFEKMDRDNPSHDTAELVHACRAAMQMRTQETSQLSVAWMTKMLSDKDELTKTIAVLRKEIDVLIQQRDYAQESLRRIGNLSGNELNLHLAQVQELLRYRTGEYEAARAEATDFDNKLDDLHTQYEKMLKVFHKVVHSSINWTLRSDLSSEELELIRWLANLDIDKQSKV